MLYSHLSPNVEKRPWFALNAGSNNGLYGGDFGVVDGDRSLGYSDDKDHTGCLKNREPILHVETAKQIAREKRKFHLLEAVGPSPPAAVEGQKRVVALTAQQCLDALFITSSDP
ncbi:MAG: hypothetical protein WBC04_13380 [Candidatus Acidiferrales bacterium]